jgi:hypothetical protein
LGLLPEVNWVILVLLEVGCRIEDAMLIEVVIELCYNNYWIEVLIDKEDMKLLTLFGFTNK